MLISIISLFPQIIESVFKHSIAKRTLENQKAELHFVDLRAFGLGAHKTVDDKPYGGGVGMVLRVDVLDDAINATRTGKGVETVILLDPKGKTFNQKVANDYTKLDHLILVCGHYEGFDDRIRSLVDEEVSIGDYILSGGEIAAIVIIDSMLRLIPGALKQKAATDIESFREFDKGKLLEYPQYTRPEVYKGMAVPHIILKGDHKEIEKFRTEESKRITKERRPDLIKIGIG